MGMAAPTGSRRRAGVALVVAAAIASTCCVMAVEAADSSVCAASTCIANGESECDRETADCPPCMYLLSSGSFSCYDLVDGACPYDGTYVVCDSSSGSSSSSSSSASVSDTTTTAPSTMTTAPSTTTTAPSATTATPTAAASSSNSSDSSAAGTVTPIVKTSATMSGSGSALRSSSSSSNSAATDSTTSTPTPTPSSSAGPSSSSSSSSSSSGSASSVSTSSSDKNSSDVVMIAVLVGAAAVGIVVVAVFIAHRVRKNRMAAHEPYRSTFGGDGAMFAVPTAKSFGLRFASRSYSSHHTPTMSNSITVLGGGSENLDNSIVMLADSPTRGVTQPSGAGVTLLSMSSLSSSTADFSLGPQFRPDESAIVDLTASTSSLKTHPPASPMTLDASLTRKHVAGPTARAVRAQLVPQAIVEGQEEEDEFSSFEQQSRYVRLASAESVIYCKRDLESSGVSISSSMSSQSDEYDIVDPHTLREGEHRNTELVVRDSEFPKFSAFSESDLLSEDGDSEAGDDAAKEHEI